MKTVHEDPVISIPVWRPGRYEIANYSQFIKDFKVKNRNGQQIKYEKVSHSDWKINSEGQEFWIEYSFYSDRIDAGFSYVDDNQVYLNPVNCFFYVKEESCSYEIQFDLPGDYIIYSPLKKKSKHILKSSSFDELFDSPTLASNNARVSIFKARNYTIRNVFQGIVNPNMKKLEGDFKKFINLQIKCFGDLPEKEFTFLNQITSHKFFHGVEHKKNTVLAFGPGYFLNQEKGYQRFLGLACHEFYHIWNVKHLRPAEMHPYDFSKENFHAVGYIIEGVTTYQGDIKLWQSRVIDNETYFELLSGEITKHLNNAGRNNQSVRESSIDLWVDGYGPGIPGKKVSIYTEGCLLAFLTDVLLLEKTKGVHGLDNVMKSLYEEFAKRGRGYDEKDYAKSVKELGGAFFSSLYNRLINQANSYESDIKKALGKVGLTMIKEPIDFVYSFLGVRVDDSKHPKILSILAGSPAEEAGLSIGYRIRSLNNINLDGNLNEWLQYFKDERFELGTTFKGNSKTFSIQLNKGLQYVKVKIQPKKKVSPNEKKLFRMWRKY